MIIQDQDLKTAVKWAPMLDQLDLVCGNYNLRCCSWVRDTDAKLRFTSASGLTIGAVLVFDDGLEVWSRRILEVAKRLE